MTDAEAEKRFEGAGQEFHAKYMGCVEVAKSKGQEVCQEAMQKLLVALKARKEPKPRLIINLSYEGTHLKEMPPGINLLDMTFKHSQISYVWKDPRDQRSLGIVRTEVDPADASKFVHKFHGIRTIKPAMPFLQEMQDLFRIVKERSAQQKERAASIAVTAAAAPAEAANQQPAAPAAVPAAAAATESRDRALSNLMGADQSEPAGLPKNDSVASLDDLGDIFSASATIGFSQQQPMGGVGGPFGQPMGAPAAASNPFGQPMGGGAFSQPMGQFRPQAPTTNPFGQQPQQPQQRPIMTAAYPYGQPNPTPFGQQQQQPQQPYQSHPQQMYYQPQQPPQQQPQYQQQYQPQFQQQYRPPPPPSTNPFASGFTSVFDRQNSAPSGDLLTPVSLTPTASSGGPAVAKPDAFGDLVTGLGGADPKRQQVSGKDLFKPIDKPKASLREMSNQSPRP